MKFCPVCQTRYDEEILLFCTTDGTPLVEENPTFTALPSESGEAEDIGEETLIRRNNPQPAPATQPDAFDEDFSEEPSGQRIIISTRDEVKEEPPPAVVRAKAQPQYQQPPQKSNTTLVVLATMFGTFTVLALLGGVWYFLSNRNSANANANKTVNVNLNTAAANTNNNPNFNTDSSANFNFNANVIENVNANVNANVKTPTPTRTPTPTPTRTPEDENVNANSNANFNLGNANVMSRPTATPTASPTPQSSPRTTPSPPTTPQNVNVGVMNSRAVNLVKPAYPQSAKQMNASGQVVVQITVDEDGNVTSARAVSGHPLLRASAENAARQSRFNPVRIGDRTVSATGLVVYNFINQ